jgi:hypothetical protein
MYRGKDVGRREGRMWKKRVRRERARAKRARHVEGGGSGEKSG